MARSAQGRFWYRLSLAGLAAVALAAGAIWLTRSAPAIATHLSQAEGEATPAGTLSLDGLHTVAVRNDGSAEVRTASGDMVGVVRGHGAPIVYAGFSPDGGSVQTIDAAGLMRKTALEGLRARDAPSSSAPAVRRWAADRLWRPLGRPLAAAIAGAEWAVNPMSDARRLTDPSVRAPVLPRGVRPPAGAMFRDCADCPEMVVIPAGRALLGSPDQEAGRDEDEGPQREMMLEEPLAIGRFEVTVQHFRQFTRETGHLAGAGCYANPDADGAVRLSPEANWSAPGFDQALDHPVVCISWDDATLFASWLSAKTGQQYRLLTEAEWEYAARAGTATPHAFGADDIAVCEHANSFDEAARASAPRWSITSASCDDGYLYTAPGGRFAANAFGLYDMPGNVAEWVEDCYAAYNPDFPTDFAFVPTDGCAQRVVRGGGYDSDPAELRSAHRLGSEPDLRMINLGFRVARVVPGGT